MPQGHDYASTTIFRRDLPLSFFTASIKSLRAFDAFFRQYDLPPRYDILIISEYAKIRHDLSPMDWKG